MSKIIPSKNELLGAWKVSKSVRQLARAYNVSQYTMTSWFRMRFGMTPEQYFIRRKR